LGKIYHGVPATLDRYWLVRFRSEIRTIRRLEETAILSHVIEQTNSRNILILAIWLRGRCGGHLGTEIVADQTKYRDLTIRKEVVRALARMNAWPRLQEIVDGESVPRIRHMATGRPPKQYGKRLSTFTQNVTPIPVPEGKQWFYVSPNVDVRKWRPPKPAHLIREILERIRHLVQRWQRE
jgi:hypothetical protein